MEADVTVDRYYYIFDSRARRTLVLDRRTGKEVVWTAAPLVGLLEHVAEEQSPATVRRFARWCARLTGADTAPEQSTTGRLWEAARREEKEGARAVRRETTDAVVRAVALDLPQGQTEAARLLATHACTFPSALEAAVNAAHMCQRWVEFGAESDPVSAVQRVRQRQIDWLLDTLGTS